MNRQNLLRIFGRCCRIFMVTLLLLLGLFTIQNIILELWPLFSFNDHSMSQTRLTPSAPVSETVARQQRISSSSRLFLPDGTIHLAYRTNKPSVVLEPENEQTQIYDINDNLIWQGSGDKLPEKYLKWPATPRQFSNTYYTLRSRNNIFPDSRRTIVVPVQQGKDVESLWRYENSGRYFTGFDMNGKRIGYFGSAGFAKEKSQIKPFEEPERFMSWIPLQGGGPIMLWQSKHSIYQIDFGKQIVDLLFQSPDKRINGTEIQNWMELAPAGDVNPESQKSRPMIFCTTEDGALFLVFRNPSETIKINVPDDIKTRIIQVTATQEKIYVSALDSGMNPPKELFQNPKALSKWIGERNKEPIKRAEELYEVSSNGDLTLMKRFEWTSPPGRLYFTANPREIHQKFLSIFSPALYDPIVSYLIRLHRKSLAINDRDFYIFLVEILKFTPGYDSYNYLLSLLMAGIVFIHAMPRRKSMVGFIAWVVFAALFNVVGLLVYLALNYTPTVRCHGCNKRRGLETPLCSRCGADLPIPAADKLNIIAGT